MGCTMLTSRCTNELRNKLSRIKFIKAECFSSDIVSVKDRGRSTCMKSCNQLKISSSHLTFNYDETDGLYRQQIKLLRCNNLTISDIAINGASSFSSINTFRQFSSSSAHFNNSSYLDDSNILPLNETVSTSIGALNEPSSASSELDGSESGTELLEPSFQSLGLGGWSPPGMVQSGLEYLHVTCDLPWWACIFCGTVVIRSFILPLVIKHQKGVIVMSNAMPQLQLLQVKMMNAREAGNIVEAVRYNEELIKFVREKKINPLKNIAIPLLQMPFFLSFFFGLRGMADLPVESLRNGGLWWFSDLTVCDPFYVLPVVTSLTMFLTIELGLESGMTPDQMPVKYVKYFLRAMPVIMLPVMINFPSAILVYWLSTNVYSLVQSSVLRIPKIRNFFGFEASINNTEAFRLLERLQKNPDKGFKEGFKESLTNIKISQDMMERKMLESEEFNKMKRQIVKKNQGK